MRAVSILLLLVLGCLSTAARKNAQSKLDKAWKGRKVTCEKTTCAGLVPEEAYNCVNKCTSDSCFAEIYGVSPLEDGEIDHARGRGFASCARKEQREVQSKDRSKSGFETLQTTIDSSASE
jgi:hypothetical protein